MDPWSQGWDLLGPTWDPCEDLEGPWGGLSGTTVPSATRTSRGPRGYTPVEVRKGPTDKKRGRWRGGGGRRLFMSRQKLDETVRDPNLKFWTSETPVLGSPSKSLDTGSAVLHDPKGRPTLSIPVRPQRGPSYPPQGRHQTEVRGPFKSLFRVSLTTP